MSYVDLSLVKSQAAIYHDADDVWIQGKIDSAEAEAASYMNRPRISDHQSVPWIVSNIDVDSGSSETLNTVPATVVQAIIMVVLDGISDREKGGSLADNPGAMSLLFQHRIGLGV
ncbi:head-tail connector protein [Methylophaga sp. OBS4]|uniref:head-tail connector protein n=1 Tax=Methylophaga sp. OBS4 TaxID=2991935 RepID=UPI00225B6225|nr:head-tail connector protein [Methylophaga sp. OBS4]MCX4186769.1 phage gp6-like head-tail connector protein [Methylophaga sp. OBS4]